LPDYPDSFKDSRLLEFKLTEPISLCGTRAAPIADFTGDRRQLVDEICVMDILFIVIATAIRNDAGVKDMNLAHRPRVEPRFDEQVFQNGVCSDLQVAGA
jgi:hypothetical protein